VERQRPEDHKFETKLAEGTVKKKKSLGKDGVLS
jgi:hypothetical protein